MKKSILLFSILLLGLNTWSQNISFTLDSTITYSFSSLNDSTIIGKALYSYDADGNQTLYSRYDWDSNLSDWVYRSKSEYSYDADGNQTLIVSYNWHLNVTDWVAGSKDELFFDADGNRTLTESYSWDSNLSDWVYRSKSEDSYDADGNQALYIFYNWDSNLSDWVVSSKSEYSYDADGNQILYILYNWASNLTNWTLTNKVIYYYSANNYFFTNSFSLCEGDSILWQGSYYDTEGTYTANYLTVESKDSIYELTLTVFPRPLPFNISGVNFSLPGQTEVYTVPENNDLTYNWLVESGDILSYPNANSTEVQWTNIGEGYIYSIAIDSNGCVSDTAELQVNIGVDNINDFYYQSNIKIYPNPVQDFLYISTHLEYQAEIFDMMGRKLLTTRKNEIDVSGIESGTYVLKFKDLDGNVLKTERILIE